MIYRVIILGEAKQDIRDIHHKIAFNLGAPIAADRQFNRLMDAIEGLNLFPNRFSILHFEEESLKEIRRMLVDRYSVFYKVDEEKRLVLVLTVCFSASDFRTKLIKTLEDRNDW